MANYYVYSGAAGAGTGADWANAYTTIGAAVTSKVAGDVFYIAHDHSETTAGSVSLASPGTEATPCKFYCVNRAGSVPPVSADLRTTAVIACTGANTISLSGTGIIYGVIFNAGDLTNGPNINIASQTQRSWVVSNCSLRLLGTGTGKIIVGSNTVNTANLILLENTTVRFSAAGQYIAPNNRVIWKNTPNFVMTAGTIPTQLFWISQGGSLFCEGCDFSAMTSGKALINAAPTTMASYTFKDCRLGAGPNSTGSYAAFGGAELIYSRCDSGDVNYRSEKYNFMGNQQVSTGTVRAGGASDGTTTIAWLLTPAAAARWEFPFECLPIMIWNETIGSSVTVNIYGTCGGTMPTNKEVWIDVEYLGTSGFPQAVKATNTVADGLAAATSYSADGSTWTGANPNKFKMAVTVTPQEKGPITIYVKTASTNTFVIDPRPVIS